MAGSKEKGLEAAREIKRLRKQLVRHRDCLRRMLVEAENYTDGQECVFCSGYEGYEPADEREDEKVKHYRYCVTRQAGKLLAEEIGG